MISSANLTTWDWSIWSNCIWFKDFPKKTPKNTLNPPKGLIRNGLDFNHDFRMTLASFVQSLMPIKIQYPELIGIDIDDYLISGIDIILIPSVPGKYSGKEFERYGHSKIGAMVRKFYPCEPNNPNNYLLPKKHQVTYQTSSVGNFSEDLFRELLSSFLPNYLSLDQLKEEAGQGDIIYDSVNKPSKRVKVIYPTKEYVESCIAGQENAICLVLPRKDYNRPAFTKNVFYQFKAPDHYVHHEGILPHLKVCVMTGDDGEITDDCWIYFGSHNFSASAWGRYENQYQKFSIFNTELGIFIPPEKGRD